MQGVQLYIEITDDATESSTVDEIVAVLLLNHNLRVGVESSVSRLQAPFVTMELTTRVLCAPAFTGAMCDVNIDDCVGEICSGNGHCVDGINSFTCVCNDGFTGQQLSLIHI